MHEVSQNSLGLWERCLSWITDHLMVLILTWPIFLVLYGSNMGSLGLIIPLFFVFSSLYTMYSWAYKGASLGKLAFSAQIVDSQSGNLPTFKQCLIRYVGSWISLMCFGLGLFWIKVDAQKRAWHDRWSGTRVILIRAIAQDED